MGEPIETLTTRAPRLVPSSSRSTIDSDCTRPWPIDRRPSSRQAWRRTWLLRSSPARYRSTQPVPNYPVSPQGCSSLLYRVLYLFLAAAALRSLEKPANLEMPSMAAAALGASMVAPTRPSAVMTAVMGFKAGSPECGATRENAERPDFRPAVLGAPCRARETCGDQAAIV